MHQGAEITPIDNEGKRPKVQNPAQKPDPIPIPGPGNGRGCPRCGMSCMFEILEITPEGTRLRCTCCNTEFIR
jgi:hypothetical protein